MIAPVAVGGKLALPMGTELSGEVAAVKAAADQVRATMQLVFNQIGAGANKTKLQAVLSGLDNARETVGNDGTITGIDASSTYASQLDQGVEKLKGNDKFSALAGIIDTARQVLKVQSANANIDYDGVRNDH